VKRRTAAVLEGRQRGEEMKEEEHRKREEAMKGRIGERGLRI